MKRINIKVFFTTMLVITISSFIPNIIIFITQGSLTINDGERPSVLIMFVAIFMVIMAFSFVMNKIIFARIKKLNAATKEVINGNYDIVIDEGAKDEIADMIRNFNTMVGELQSNEYLSKEFVRNFSHELKTPLAAIKGYSDLIIDSDLPKKELLEYATIISNESSRLSELSKNMLLISLVDSHVIIPKKDKFNVAEQIRNVLQLTQLEWEKKSLNFELNLQDKEIVSNKEMFYQVWINLISNAIKFSNEGNTIKIDLGSDENKMRFEISNDGNIEPHDITQLFNLFYVIEKSRTKHSSGIGLTLTKKIVNKFQGDITVESKDNKVIFTVEIPIG